MLIYHKRRSNNGHQPSLIIFRKSYGLTAAMITKRAPKGFNAACRASESGASYQNEILRRN
jgi:hypothetical protein